MSRCRMALFKSLVRCIKVSVWSSADGPLLLMGNLPGITGVLLLGVAYSSIVLSGPKLLEFSSPPKPDGAGVSGLAKLGSDAFFAVNTLQLYNSTSVTDLLTYAKSIGEHSSVDCCLKLLE